MHNGFTWYWEANDWFPWALPNTTDYMYSSYQVGSGYRRDPGVNEPSSFGEFLGCGDVPTITLENQEVKECREFFPGWSCNDEQLTNYSSGNCSASCGYCTPVCFDTDLFQSNSHGYGCEIYNEMPLLCDIAESYDDDDFTASFHCCVCGGGSKNLCLPNDFVTAPRSDGTQDNAMVVDVLPDMDMIIVEFPYLTGAQRHEFPRTEVTNLDGRPCASWGNTIYQEGWGR
jgi:hypothetical protein